MLELSSAEMWFYCVLLSIFFVHSHGSTIRIVNGTDAEEGEFPFAVSLRRNNRLTCGATILNAKFVLTAAHCICSGSQEPMDKKIFNIQYGLTKITNNRVNIREIANITCHTFVASTLIYDAAVLELDQPLPNDGSWKAVTLSKNFDSLYEQKGIVIGWGRLAANGDLPDNLQKLDVTVYDDYICGRSFDNKHHVCFGSPIGGACNGDSGTALIVNGEQVGIASFITDTCGISNRNNPNVYARVEAYYYWIQSIAGNIN